MDVNNNIALVSPIISDRFAFYNYGPRIVNMGLGYVNSFLKDQGFHCNIVDIDNYLHNETELWKHNQLNKGISSTGDLDGYLSGSLENQLFDEIVEKILQRYDWSKYKIIGVKFYIDLLYDLYTPVLFKLLQIIHQKYHTVIILGGTGGLTLQHLKTLKQYDFIKYLTFGLIDSINLETTLKIVKYEIDGIEFDELENAIYISDTNQKIKFNVYQKTADVKTERNYILKPLYSLPQLGHYEYGFEKLPEYDNRIRALLPAARKISIIPYRFMIGCPNHCAFCMCSAQGEIYACKDPEAIANDLDQLMYENQSSNFMFLNATFNISKKFIADLHNAIKRKNLKLSFSDSVEFNQMDRECLEMIKDMGGVALWYGLECPSDRMLQFIHKKCTVAEAENVLRMSDDVGIWNGVNFISGLPYEQDEDIRNTAEFIHRNAKYIDMWSLNPFYLTKSRFYDQPDHYGIEVLEDIVEDQKRGNVLMSSFNEKNGLKWEEKQKQIEQSYETTNKIMIEHQSVTNFTNLYLILHGMHHFQDKKAFKSWMVHNCRE